MVSLRECGAAFSRTRISSILINTLSGHAYRAPSSNASASAAASPTSSSKSAAVPFTPHLSWTLLGLWVAVGGHGLSYGSVF
jgi:hypothetical protein